ncbi:hypothetical protein BH23PLA1_BH23PLA1_28840 [soil metagenome]
MILVAATAAGLAWARDDWVMAARALEMPRGPVGIEPLPMEFARRLQLFTKGASRLLACSSIAVLIVCLRPPRPRRASLLFQPGLLAVAMATAYTATNAVNFLLALLIRAKYKPSWTDYAGQAVPAYETAKSIMAAWLILAISGLWRPEPSWIDRLGRLIGLSWIALLIAAHLFDWW